MIRKIKCKKAQQEIMGFTLIVVLVVIIMLVFLTISVRKSKSEIGKISIEDAEISNFLSASMGYTTDCVINEPFYADLEDLVKECRQGAESSCADGRKVCGVAQGEYEKMISELWLSGESRHIKYTKLSAYYEADGIKSEPFITAESGSSQSAGCAVRRAGKRRIDTYPGSIIIEMEICKAGN